MFIFELFEAKPAEKTVVILPGGFHPFHPGHLSLYNSAQKMFPGADIYYAATNDKEKRPFDITDKARLAQIAGVPAGHFVQVKSPFQAKEITANYDPNSTVLVFARSEKDQDQPPHAGGVKKDGNPAYLQPYTKNPAPMSQHGYMAYLPTVEFPAGPSGVTSATQIRDMWPQASSEQKAEIVGDLYPKNPRAAHQILDKYLGEDANAEMGAITVDSTSPIHGESIDEHIVKVKGGYRLVSKKSGRNLGTYPTRAGAENREREVQYFKHQG
jgi:glycerol-3-phosphate cytidylyltransferase-like family protein